MARASWKIRTKTQIYIRAFIGCLFMASRLISTQAYILYKPILCFIEFIQHFHTQTEGTTKVFAFFYDYIN